MVSGGINMFGHHSFDNYSLPFRSDGECTSDDSEWSDWNDCVGNEYSETSYQSRTKSFHHTGTDECYTNLEDKVKSIATSMKDDGLLVSITNLPVNDKEGFLLEERRECTPEVEEITGCMRVDAINYNPDATEDDGSCEYSTRPMFTNSSPEPAMVKTEDPIIETTSKTPYLSIIAFLAASGVLGNGVNHHYQITDRIKAFGTKILERVS